MNKNILIALLSITILFFSSCEKKEKITFKNSNINKDKIYFLDYENAFSNGFIIPSKLQDGTDFFELNFELKDFENEELFYKVYYQNESYKFPEEIDGAYNPLAAENFYGSWEDVEKEFEPIKSSEINCSFRILGNPRNESRYYGQNSHDVKASDIDIIKKSAQIKSDEKWLKSIQEKAKLNGVTDEEQLRRDAAWSLSQNSNNKWQRNPRVGNYNFLVVVTTKKGLEQVPTYIKNISQSHDGVFINPFYYFLHGEGKSLPDVRMLQIDNFITAKANVPLTKGIYVPFNKDRFESKDFFNEYVNDSKTLYDNATFAYKHTYQSNTEFFMNVPILSKFHSEGYTLEEYEKNKRLGDDKRIKTFFTHTRKPGETFGVNKEKNAIWFKNPANKEGEYKKENVGIKTRHGFTYGKYTFKIKMAELLTEDNVWTGLTNAIWMINEGGEDWNRRRICEKEGFMPFYGAGKGETRVPQISYSEIDFEILKAAETWPRLSYADQQERNDPESHKNKVMIACTNWDMACKQPTDFGTGLRHIDYEDKTFNVHRWDEYYNALTSKVPEVDDELFSGEYYYFQLEWSPTEIIWRVGPEKNKLRLVGYMNDKVTTIPNNQMLATITQEYHFSKWWPKSPFNQEDVPFPAEDLNGMLYSLEIE
jgi:hypothetical protein